MAYAPGQVFFEGAGIGGLGSPGGAGAGIATGLSAGVTSPASYAELQAQAMQQQQAHQQQQQLQLLMLQQQAQAQSSPLHLRRQPQGLAGFGALPASPRGYGGGGGLPDLGGDGSGALSMHELYGLPPEARNILYKTEMCKNFMARGMCQFAGCVRALHGGRRAPRASSAAP